MSADSMRSHHEDLVRRDSVEGSSDRSFGVAFAFVFSIVGLLPVIHGGTPRVWSLAVGAIFLTVAVVCPRALKTLNRAWFKVGQALHRVASPVILAVLFFLVLTPVAVLARLFRRDELGLRLQPRAATYWADRLPAEPSDFRRQY